MLKKKMNSLYLIASDELEEKNMSSNNCLEKLFLWNFLNFCFKENFLFLVLKLFKLMYQYLRHINQIFWHIRPFLSGFLAEGKTTLSNRLLKRLQKRERSIHLRNPRDVPRTITYPISNIIFLLAIKSNQRRCCLAMRRPSIISLLSRDSTRKVSETRTTRKSGKRDEKEREGEEGDRRKRGDALRRQKVDEVVRERGIKLTGSTALSHLFCRARIMRLPWPSLMLCRGCSQLVPDPRRHGRHKLALPFVFYAVLPIISK